MNAEKKARIRGFINDAGTSLAVYEELMRIFTKPQEVTNTEVLAAERIAINRLQDAWKELSHYKTEVKEERENTQKAL